MKKLQIIAAAAVLGAVSMSVQAESSASVAYVMYDFDGGPAPTGVNVSYGRSFTDMIDGEVYVGSGIGDDAGVDAALTYGLEAVAHTEVSEGIEVYGMVSMNFVEVDIDVAPVCFPIVGCVGGGSGSADDTTAGFGVGASYAVGSGAVFAEYRGIDMMDVTSLDIGYKMNF